MPLQTIGLSSQWLQTNKYLKSYKHHPEKYSSQQGNVKNLRRVNNLVNGRFRVWTGKTLKDYLDNSTFTPLLFIRHFV